ncbi:NADPH oxidase organizer 1a isoform X3 [Hippocampus zosterae]|uniref:NADPH oxidase organizer 1a isoform X3 n=1 Tax=Hippocampus zosterae TaxID=109293 RepID=UPI00223DEA8D|nr:NADPH oxidase organizer 1a isoform X3 [Hippocampus zosterae]
MSSQRYPISIRLTGVMEKDKKKMYITSVLWSDEEEIVIYRTIEDFKKMHKQIKKAFPGMKKSERIVPKFKVTKKAKAGQKNGTSKSLNYLKPLQRYCNELLSCDPKVNQSVHLIQFLHPKNEELQAEYSKNGVIIMPPETQAQQELIYSQGGNVTQPFSTETYRCVAPYETKDTKNKPFKVALNEKVDVLIKDKAGWWLVENDDKCLAWFPAPYLERTDDEPEEDNIDGLPERGLFYTVTKSYKSTKDDEITVSIGASVEVLQKSENGWWLIRYQGKAGYIPSMYLKPPSYGHVGRGHHGHNSPILLSPSNLTVQPQSITRSQDNLQEMNTARPAASNLLRPLTRQLSRSAEVLNQPPSTVPASKPPPVSLPKPRPNPPPKRAASPNPGYAPPPNTQRASPPKPGYPPPPNTQRAPSPKPGYPLPPNASYVPTPIIMVKNDSESDVPSSQTWDSETEFTSDSDFSSDEFSLSSASMIDSMSMSTDDYRLHSRTPPPPSRNTLSPQSANGGRMTPAISDPNIFKSVSTPKVPPRPQTNEILSRCTTITRKNANRDASPTQTTIHTR